MGDSKTAEKPTQARAVTQKAASTEHPEGLAGSSAVGSQSLPSAVVTARIILGAGLVGLVSVRSFL